MQILYLTNGFPFPLTSGYLRHYYLLRELSRDHDVTLLSLVGPSHREEHVDELRPFTKSIQTFASRTKGQSLPRKIAGRFRLWVEVEPAVREMRTAVARMEQKFDAVFCGKLALPAIEPVADLPLVADMCDAASMRVRLSMRYASLPRRMLLGLEYLRTLRVEKRAIRDARCSVFVSCRDRDTVIGNSGARSTIVPNGVDVDFWKRSSPERGHNTIVFTGAMDYRPNVDAALHLCEEILPAVRRSVPDARVLIVGRDPTPRLRAAGRKPGVEVTGFVEDVRTYLEPASVFAAPLRFGAGIQNKLLEAMAMEVPVVASPLAADGLRTEDGQRPPLDVAEDQDRFVALLVKRLRDPDTAPDAAARGFVRDNFVWSRSGARLSRVLQEAAGNAETREVLCSPSL
jgi:glycosyltransferase involved in cell wall biosynthesis